MHARKKFSVGIAEKVDGLHGVAHYEDSAPNLVWPCAEEAGQQLVLATAGVLKLIHQQMPDIVRDVQRRIAGQPVLAHQHALGNLSHLNKVHRSRLGENDSQLACRMAQQRETGANDGPVLIGVAGRRQAADGGQGRLKSIHLSESTNQFEQPVLFGLAIRREADRFVHSLTKPAVVGEHQRCQPGVSNARLFNRLIADERSGRELRKLCKFLVD